jgi:hypothetical protein
MVSTTPHPSLNVDELQHRIKQVEPAAFLVPPRLLRRVIKHHRKIGGIGLLVPHSKGYGIDRDSLLACVAPTRLGLDQSAQVPPFVYLLARPRFAKDTLQQALLKYWRIIFHLHIDQAMQAKLANGSLTPAVVRQRVRHLGLTEFAEITTVLQQENYLLPPESLEAVYAEFVAVYLTLRRFDPDRAPHFFPALRDLSAVDALVAEDIDAEAIYNATRLPGAPEPVSVPPEPHPSLVAPLLSPLPMDSRPSEGPAELRQLSERLKKALELTDTTAWHDALLPLWTHAARGGWSQEARLLHDLQSMCFDSEHGIYTVDLVEWVMSLGQLPIKRRLPGHHEVAIVRRLRLAMRRLRFFRVTEPQRQSLTHLLTQALEHREHLIRERFRPHFTSFLEDVGLKAHNAVEQIGQGKLVEELLDRVVETGHLNLGNLRDSLSRNQLKLTDLKGPAELVMGDPLIRLNRKLAVNLDGVYRRGEIYLRMLHRLSSVFFGTPLGRLLVLFLIFPFGLAFFVMITPGIAVEEGQKLVSWLGQLVGLMEKPPETHHHASHAFPMPNLWGVAGLGVFILLLFHVDSFRTKVFAALGKLGLYLHMLFIGGPVWLARLPAVQAILHNPFWGWFRRLLFWPALAATAGALIASWTGLEPPAITAVAGTCIAVVMVLLNTPLGREMEETTTDWLLGIWLWFNVDFAPGLLRLIMDVSHRCLDAVEHMLYAVNEWLRFRSGENQVVICIKAVLGLLWFWVTYIIRFAINLLIEPQINPIKHFPVVTVSHKFCLPMIPLVRDILVAQFGLARARALALATGIITGIPGIFGFMVWELKENWRLYASNRPRNLKPVLIGSHGETMLRLLHPGFHSGTIPKLYKKLRRAERHDQERTVRKILASLHHVSESIAHFIEREFLALLRQSKARFGLDLELERVSLATNRVLVALRCRALGEKPLVLSFDHQHGWLIAGVIEPGWLPLLNAGQKETLGTALVGLYKMAGVHLTREQITAILPPTTFAFEIKPEGLQVWTECQGIHDALYDLTADPQIPPQPLNGALPADLPALDMSRLIFSNMPLPWHEWVRAWATDHPDSTLRQQALSLLPPARELDPQTKSAW